MSFIPSSSAWFKNVSHPRYPRLARNERTDVVVIGAGITGLTAAYLLRQAGCNVIVLERDRVGLGDTGHTTAHITAMTDLRLHEQVRRFGRDHTLAVWEAGEAAIHQIRDIVTQEEIDCGLRTVPAYLHESLDTESPDERKKLMNDHDIASKLGIDASFVEKVPGVHRAGIAFPDQALFHPIRYLAALAAKLDGKTCRLFEHSEAKEVTDEPLTVKANGHSISCDWVFIATHVPLMGKTGLIKAALLQTKLYPYTSYAIQARVPKGTLPVASLFDTSNPYYYLRIDPRRGHDRAIFGGQDHKTGQATKTAQRYKTLEWKLRSLVPNAKVDARWSGQVIETSDGLPYIGETSPRQFISTGFSGNGMTFGTLGAMMMRDAVLERCNPWRTLFDVHRKIVRGTLNYLKENLDYPYYMVKDRLARSEGKSVRSVRREEGKLLRINGKRMAVYRDTDGRLTKLSPICTHLGCLVRWNDSERTWDCPCHGSRFHATGEVLAGPAEESLKPAGK